LGREVGAFENLQSRGLSGPYTATYSRYYANLLSTEVIYVRDDGSIAYQEYYPRQPEAENFLVYGRPAVYCSPQSGNRWTCSSDPDPNGWSMAQTLSVPYTADLDVQNYFAPGLAYSSPQVTRLAFTHREIDDVPAECLNAAVSGEQPMNACVAVDTGQLLSYSHTGDPTIEIDELSDTVPAGAFTPPATPTGP
jgi:hypothetical protein